MKAEAAVCLVVAVAGCGGGTTSPTAPSPSAVPLARTLVLEAEAGTGDGQMKRRSAASNGQTIHLAPGERRQWVFKVDAGGVRYALSVTYSNGRGRDNETLSVTLDGAVLRTFRNRDSGEDDEEGWNSFVTDPTGVSVPDAGVHTLAITSSGGDGCVEIDLMRLTPSD